VTLTRAAFALADCATYADLARTLARPDSARLDRVTIEAMTGLPRRAFDFGRAKPEDLASLMNGTHLERQPAAIRRSHPQQEQAA